jgi:AraC family carnitine catabolism transcriptional activator
MQDWTQSGPVDWRVRESLRRMASRIREPLDLPGLARAFGITPRHLSRLFLRQTGRSPRATLRAMRLEQGALLLRGEPSLAVEEVAWRVGMDPSHFTRAFKARYGCCPAEYRRARLLAPVASAE